MSEVKHVFDTLGMTPEQCQAYIEAHKMLPQKIASVMLTRARGAEGCQHVDKSINEAKEFIRKIASKLDSSNIDFYLDFDTPAPALSDDQKQVQHDLFPAFFGQRFSMLMDEFAAALAKMCSKFTKEQIESALAE